MPMSASRPSTAAVRSGVSGERTAERTGTESPAAASATAAAVEGAGGLDTSITRSVAGSASSAARASSVARPPTASDRSRPPTPSTCETPTPAMSSRQEICCAPVPDAATRPTGPGRTTLAKPRATPETIAVPQSGPITRTPASCAARFNATSCSTGTPSEKTRTLRPAAIASAASAMAYWPGTLTIASAGPSEPSSSRPAPIVRCGTTVAGPVERSRSARAASTAARAAARASSSSARIAISSCSGEVSPSGARPMFAASSRFRGVAMATRTAVTPSRAATSRLTCMSRTESA
jgi:hypothetical protein